MRRSSPILAAAALAWLALPARPAPATPGSERPGDPLFDSRHPPAVLVEARRLALPPVLEPNRLVRGWTPWHDPASGLRLIPAPAARLQVVDIEPRSRRLIFDGTALGRRPASLEVRIGDLRRRVVIEDRFAIDLPPASAPGRRMIELRPERPGTYALRSVAIEPADPGGGARCGGDGCRQAGPSLIEAVRRVAPGTRLSGVFVPPERPAPGQRFVLSARLETGGERSLFVWRADGRRRVVGRRPFDVEIAAGDAPVWVRLRFLATGGGSTAVWRGLRLSPPSPAAAVPPPAIPPPPPVVVVYVMDAWRADHVSHLGGEEGLTPRIDRLASGGATFRRHLTIAPNTLPSTKSLFTGDRFLTRGGAGLAAGGPRTLAEAFAAAGYRTGLFSANGHASPVRGTDRGFEYVDSSVLVGGPEYDRSGPGYNDSAERVHRAALAWLDRVAGGASGATPAPVFLYLHTIHPHTPYDPPPDLVERFTRGLDSSIDGSSRTLRDIGQGRYRPTAVERRRLARLYAASVAYGDREIGAFLDELGERYRSRDVLFVLTSDHGEELFDHGGVLHGYTLYDEALHVPLVVHWPGAVAPDVIGEASGTLDVHDGLVALVDSAFGARRPGFWRHLGRSWPVDLEPRVQFAAAASVPGGIFAARSERFKVIWAPQVRSAWGMGGGGGRRWDWEYVFDLAAGGETVNLAGDLHPEVDWLRSRLTAWVESGLRAETGGAPVELDDAARAGLRALGYID